MKERAKENDFLKCIYKNLQYLLTERMEKNKKTFTKIANKIFEYEKIDD